ncbi:MAG: TadE/TadG family type IV pilus assembly protein [Terracidiphilus sp.]
MRKVKSLIFDEDGAEIMAFALSATVLFMLIFVIIELCLMCYAYNSVALAAQQGTRYAMVRGSDWTSACATTASFGCEATATNVQNYILNQPHPGINLTAAEISVTWPGTPVSGTNAACTANAYAQGCEVKVTVSYPFTWNIPFIKPGSKTLNSTSIETIQD